MTALDPVDPSGYNRGMSDRFFDGKETPEQIAAKLNLIVVHWHEDALYARDEHVLFELKPEGGRVRVSEAPTFSESYVGEDYHTPKEGAVHAGLTVIEETSSGDVVALDGFGRKYRVNKTGNGPMASSRGWATAEELKQWAPAHRPWQKTTT